MSNKNSLEIAYQNARDLIHKKEYLQAISQLNEIIKVFPNELNSIYLLIDCFIKIIFLEPIGSKHIVNKKTITPNAPSS